jgi:hypothetical protein
MFSTWQPSPLFADTFRSNAIYAREITSYKSSTELNAVSHIFARTDYYGHYLSDKRSLEAGKAN